MRGEKNKKGREQQRLIRWGRGGAAALSVGRNAKMQLKCGSFAWERG